ncbi:MAG: YqgE/AlgH family protein [Nitrosomonas sp.]|nr:YqgE/AlgH family protein [Nitrosomonas sp.]
MENVNLTDHFLIAMPSLENSFFAKTLIYVCEHDEEGALGLVVNRPTDISVEKLLQHLGISPGELRAGSLPVLVGGPVQVDGGFVLHQPVGLWQSTLTTNATTGLTASIDILQAAAHHQGPDKMLVTLGYAGWAAGQLEQELAQNAWLTVPASAEILFEMPSEKRLPAAMELLSIDYCHLSHQVGHA